MSAPAPGTRPANRREIVVAAASELFHDRGYSNVSMKDIADAVAVGPSSLYRHFRNKNDLLEAVIADDLAAVLGAVDAASDRSGDLIVARPRHSSSIELSGCSGTGRYGTFRRPPIGRSGPRFSRSPQ
ncbi:TetR/AcrR family transcriptional regulator [Tsukamurella sp. PLM1]|uniref:TetR/AcrR family transcriptional regulator n=1 Tax=Tsukamurella sp. PLM1 TaxID=2929795 RepID=UPI0020C0C596|nr:TetR/AcrR family transcriptional regulator [Tsukamurella sp. PLM1]